MILRTDDEATSHVWTILLIGGPSSVGKSTAAKSIARGYGCPWLQIDDIRLAVQRNPIVTSDSSYASTLGFFDETADVWSQPLDQLVDAFISIGTVLTPSLRIVIGNHVAMNEPIVIEGDGLLPSFLDEAKMTMHSREGALNTVFVIPANADTILDNLYARGWGSPHLSREEAERRAAAMWAFGQWLKEEANVRGLPVIEAMPNANLEERIRDSHATSGHTPGVTLPGYGMRSQQDGHS